MSRAVLAIFVSLISPTALYAQTAENFDAAIYAKTKSEQLMDIGQDKPKCPEPKAGEEIIVCGEIDNGEDQLIYGDSPPNEDRIRAGEAISTTKAATCMGGFTQCGHRLSKVAGVGFGRVPPPAIPLEEVYRGLPEPDMVVQEGSSDGEAAPQP
jgi:hypothetical protein